jgi:hypothetical protein
MCKSKLLRFGFLITLFILPLGPSSSAQTPSEDEQYGPVVRAYLGYLRNEQNVVDDRASRHQVNAVYYRRNSNRIRALRQSAMRIVRESRNDYLPELEAVAVDELGLLFERPPQSQALRIGEVLQTKFRYLGNVRAGELFYVFARLDPYEQSELMERVTANGDRVSSPATTHPVSGVKVTTRARRVTEQ